MFKANIVVTLKNGVSDPQGQTVHQALKTLQYSGLRDVRVGKFIEICLDAKSSEEAGQEVQSICEKLLTNPIIEQYRYELVEDKG